MASRNLNGIIKINILPATSWVDKMNGQDGANGGALDRSVRTTPESGRQNLKRSALPHRRRHLLLAVFYNTLPPPSSELNMAAALSMVGWRRRRKVRALVECGAAAGMGGRRRRCSTPAASSPKMGLSLLFGLLPTSTGSSGSIMLRRHPFPRLWVCACLFFVFCFLKKVILFVVGKCGGCSGRDFAGISFLFVQFCV